MKVKRHRTFSSWTALLAAGLVTAQIPLCHGQDRGSAAAQAPSNGSASADSAERDAVPAEVTKELELMKARIDALEKQLKARDATPAVAAQPTTTDIVSAAAQEPSAANKGASASPATTQPAAPFAYADWTWLNGNARTKDAVWDSPFFTPEIRFDTNFISSFNHPKDDTIGGSTEVFRSNEVQVEQISFGGDFHWQNVRGRVLTMNGMFGVTTPRNDASPGRGQWDLRGAYKYVSEAYGGYHFLM